MIRRRSHPLATAIGTGSYGVDRGARALILGLALMIVSPESRAMLRSVPMDELTRHATMIALGRVSEIMTVGGVRIAHLRVDRTLKGEPQTDVYFVAEPSWSCDISDAREGESGLYFFTTHRFSERPQPAPEPPPPGFERESFGGYEEVVGFREEIEALGGGGPLYDLTNSGCGRLVERSIDGVDHYEYSHVWIPAESREITIGDPKRSSERAAPVAEVIAYVLQIVAEPERAPA